jgi:hypothetical protein
MKTYISAPALENTQSEQELAEAGRGVAVDEIAAQVQPYRPSVQASAAPTAGYLDQEVWPFFYKWGGLLSQTLIRIRSRFEGDLDQYLLYLIFLLAQLSQLVSRGEAEARGVRPAAWTDRGMNALSLAEITHIPRETARRKLQLLVSRGYLWRSDDGLYHLGDQYDLDAFFRDLRPLFWDGVETGRH